MILSKSKQSWHWWVAVSHKMDLKEIRSSDFIINFDTLHFSWPIFIFRTENALGRRYHSPTNDKGFLKHKTSKNFLGQANFLYHICIKCEARGLPFSNGGSTFLPIYQCKSKYQVLRCSKISSVSSKFIKKSTYYSPLL